MGDFLTAEPVEIPDWAMSAVISPVEFSNRVDGHFVRIASGALTLGGSAVYSYRTETPHRTMHGFLLVIEKGAASCGCYAERRCLLQRGEEAKLEEESWIGLLCDRHAHEEYKVSVPVVVDENGLLVMEEANVESVGEEDREED